MIFLDSNIWIYSFLESQDHKKHVRSLELARRSDIAITTQIITETCSVLYQKTKAKEDYLLELIGSFYERFDPLPINHSQLSQASFIRSRYKIPYWDSLLVAGALELGASIFYSEDLQDGLKIEDKLAIINPFK